MIHIDWGKFHSSCVLRRIWNVEADKDQQLKRAPFSTFGICIGCECYKFLDRVNKISTFGHPLGVNIIMGSIFDI